MSRFLSVLLAIFRRSSETNEISNKILHILMFNITLAAPLVGGGITVLYFIAHALTILIN